jgi:hypothetical protein
MKFLLLTRSTEACASNGSRKVKPPFCAHRSGGGLPRPLRFTILPERKGDPP